MPALQKGRSSKQGGGGQQPERGRAQIGHSVSVQRKLHRRPRTASASGKRTVLQGPERRACCPTATFCVPKCAGLLGTGGSAQQDWEQEAVQGRRCPEAQTSVHACCPTQDFPAWIGGCGPHPAHISGAATGGGPERRPGRGCGPKTLLPDDVSRLTLTARGEAGRADVAENNQPWSCGSWRQAGTVMRGSHAPGQPALGRGYCGGGCRARPLQGQSAWPTLPRAAGPPSSVWGDVRWAQRRHIRLPRGSACHHRKGPRGKRGPHGKPRDASHSQPLGALWGRCRDPCKGPHPPPRTGWTLRWGGGDVGKRVPELRGRETRT